MEQSLPAPQLTQHVFDSTGAHCNNGRVYFAYFGALPNCYVIDEISEDKVIAWARTNLTILAEQSYKSWHKKKLTNDDCIMILEHKILLNFCNECAYINFTAESEPRAQTHA
jgi:ferredoxin-fold anticodon binding domain-containing protein